MFDLVTVPSKIGDRSSNNVKISDFSIFGTLHLQYLSMTTEKIVFSLCSADTV